MHTFQKAPIASSNWNRRWQILDTLGWSLQEGLPGHLASNTHLTTHSMILGPKTSPWKDTLHSIVSSKVPKSFCQLRDWIQCVDERLIAMRAKGHTLLICRNVPTYEVLLSRARHHGVRTLTIHVSKPNVPIEKWLDSKLRLLQATPDRFQDYCFVWGCNSRPDSLDSVGIPLPDQLLCWMPEFVDGLNVRASGRIESALKLRQAWDVGGNGSFFESISASPNPSPMPSVISSRESGAERSRDALLQESLNPGIATACISLMELTSWIRQHDGMEWPWLIHCTRAIHGPWVDENPDDFYQRLITEEHAINEPSPLSTLLRILSMRRLLASCFLKRSSQPTVCLTELPLDQVLHLRRFQAHLRRWDWEPYGIGLRKQIVNSIGGRPCVYGSNESYRQLAVADRPYFQRSGHGSMASRRWEEEKEWRIVGDLDLELFRPEDAFVFVPTMTVARQIVRLSPFPIVVTTDSS